MRLILIDVDGVLTDGRVTLDVHGNETKTICYRDLDAIGIGRKAGYEFAFVTGEATPMVDVLAKRFGVEIVYSGAKDKLAAIRQISSDYSIPIKNFIYIGDSDRDAPALEAVGLGIAPKDASFSAKNAAHIVAKSCGGTGVLLEIMHKLISGKFKYPGDVK